MEAMTIGLLEEVMAMADVSVGLAKRMLLDLGPHDRTAIGYR